jgi:hypothetical protein
MWKRYGDGKRPAGINHYSRRSWVASPGRIGGGQRLVFSNNSRHHRYRNWHFLFDVSPALSQIPGGREICGPSLRNGSWSSDPQRAARSVGEFLDFKPRALPVAE